METNLSYGGIPYNHSFVIDKIYDNRKDMEDKAADDGVFVGRYVLVSYTNEALNQDEKIAIEVALNGNNPTGVYAGIITKHNVNTLGNRYYNFVTNYKTDREKYQNNTNYDKTVWRKYYRGGKQVYELVATLNSGLAINVQGVQPEETVIQIVQDENNNNIIGTKLGFGLEEKTVSGQKQKHLVLFSTPITGDTTKTEVARLDVTELIKDSFLTGVNYNNQTHTLTFKIKDEYGGQFETDVDIDIMNPGDGIDISTGFNEQEGAPAISIDLNDNPGFVNYLQLNEQGLTTNADLAEVIEFYTSAFSSLEQAEYYAQNNNKAYVGQVLTVAEEGNVRQYIIADNNKTLQLNGGGFRKILPLESVAGEGIEIKPQTSTVLFSVNQGKKNIKHLLEK